jgi:hypothetical protein
VWCQFFLIFSNIKWILIKPGVECLSLQAVYKAPPWMQSKNISSSGFGAPKWAGSSVLAKSNGKPKWMENKKFEKPKSSAKGSRSILDIIIIILVILIVLNYLG